MAGGVAGGGGGRAAAAAAGVSGAAGCRRTPRQAIPKPSCARPPGPGPQRASPLLVALTPSPTPPCRIAGALQVASALCARGNFPPRPGLCQVGLDHCASLCILAQGLCAPKGRPRTNVGPRTLGEAITKFYCGSPGGGDSASLCDPEHALGRGLCPGQVQRP